MAHAIDEHYGGAFNTKIGSFKWGALGDPTFLPRPLPPTYLNKQAIPMMNPGFPPNEDDPIRKKQKLDYWFPFEAENFQ